MCTSRQKNVFLCCVAVLLLLTSGIALCLGRYSIAPQTLYQAFFYPDLLEDSAIATVLWRVRFPRVLMALLAGAGLATAGASLQAMFANPLVSEHILGVSSGAGFGAALGIILGGGLWGIQGCSIAFGLLAMLGTCCIARKNGKIKTLMLVLSGVIVSALFSAGISMLQYIADSEKELPTIVFWLMGGLSKSTMFTFFTSAPPLLAAVFFLYKNRWQLNALSLSEEESTSLGVDVRRVRLYVVLATTLIAATVVSSCGIISFVGLIVPHFGRMVVGSDNRYLVPTSLLFGALFILVVDTFARTLTASEIPLSVMTSFIGAPFFAYLLHRTGGVWND